jgi:hypothetical protein
LFYTLAKGSVQCRQSLLADNAIDSSSVVSQLQRYLDAVNTPIDQAIKPGNNSNNIYTDELVCAIGSAGKVDDFLLLQMKALLLRRHTAIVQIVEVT